MKHHNDFWYLLVSSSTTQSFVKLHVRYVDALWQLHNAGKLDS